MKLDNIIDILISSIESGDCSIFLNNLIDDDSSKENLDSIFIKIREYISIFIDDLPQKEGLVSNALQILTDLIQTFDISSEDLALHLAKTVLLVITEERCNITIIKRAIHVFNLIIQKPEIICAVVNDESLEGSLQILGRKVPSTGDYECQALMFEALYRITCNENREYWVNIWFSDPVARSMFMELDPQKFEANCRKALNYINRSEPDRRVFSFLACSVTFGSFQLNEPYGCDLWIDFNYDSQSISFYCSEISFEESAENSGMWETILISNSSVKYYSIKDRKSEKKREVILLLNCPCYTLITSSNITNPEFNSFKIRILIWEILDIHQHLEKIYGKDKYEPDFSDHILPKVSVPTEVIRIDDGVSNNKYTPDFFDHKMPKVSAPTDVIRIDSGVSNVFPNERLSQRKISTISTPISVETCETEDVISGTEQNQNMSVIRKISETAERIHISTEVVAENLSSQGFRKISASSNVIELETSKVGEHIQKKTRRRSSVSVDAIFYDPYNDVYEIPNSCNKPHEKHPSSYHKRKVSCSVGLKLEKEEEHPIPKQGGRKRMRRGARKKQSLKLLTSSLGSLNIVNGTLNLEEDEKSKLNEEAENTTNYCSKSVRKSSFSTSRIDSFQLNELKNNAPIVILKRDSEKKNTNALVDTFDRNKTEKILKEVCNKANKETEISINCPSLIEETLNENTMCLNKSIQIEQNDTSKSSTSFVPQDTVKCKEKLAKIDGTNNNSQEREIESSISSKEADNGEMIPKIHHRRVRLYNLDSAPVYDVPPLTSSSDPVSQDCLNVSKESHAVISENRVSTHELTEEQKVESVQKTNTRRKRSSKSVEATQQRTTKDKQIRLYENFPGSDEDFQELVNRDTDKRRGEKSSATSTTRNKRNITRKRKFEASPSYDPQSVKKPAKLPRRAAMKARRKTKEMLGSASSIVTCDKIEVMNESNEDRGNTLTQRSRKRKKLFKNSTDTDTLSSEVSWMKQNKSSFLFETPKKNYSEWRKSFHKKKELPVKIVSGSKSPEKIPPRKKRKKDISKNLSVESEIKPKSLGLSDLENYNLTIEKNTKRNSYPAISALQSNFQNISASGSKRNSFKESSHAHSHLGKNGTESDSDSIVKNISREQLKQVVQVLANDKMINDHSDMSKLLHVTKYKHADSISEIGISKTDLIIPNKEHNLSNASNGDAEKGDSNCNKNYSICDEVITLHNDHDELIQEENEEESKKNQSKHTLKNTSEQVIDCFAHGFKDYIQETKGKRLILKRFLQCVAECSETQNDSTRTYASEPEVDPHQISSHVSFNSLPTRFETVSTVKSMEGSEFQSEGSKEMSLQPPSEEQADIVEHQNNGIKNKDNEPSVFPTKVKKRKIISYSEKKREYSAVDNRVAEKVNFLHSRLAANPVIDLTACRNVESQKSVDKAVTVRTVPISIEHDGSERSFTKHQHHKKSRDLNKSSNSIYSKLTSPSLLSSEKDKKWFEAIIFVLSKDANILSRKLLATVQNCYFEFITKMNALREKIIKTVEEFEGSSSPNTSHYKLRYLVKKCRINRHEVEKSLQRMRNTGKEYFETEEKCFRRLKRKNVKASRKFISNMKRAEKISVQKLEGKILLKTKYFLKRLLKHIQSV